MALGIDFRRQADQDDRIISTLPQSLCIGALLLFVGTGVDLPWLDKQGPLILAIRATLVVSALISAWVARFCKTRTQSEALAFGGGLFITTGMALLGKIEGSYLAGYMSAVLQTLAFITIFISLRLHVFALQILMVGVLWFWAFPMLMHITFDPRLLTSHIIGYFTYALMALEGNRRFSRLWAAEKKLRTDLEEHTVILHEMATRDGLTGVYNFRHFQESLPVMMREAVRREEPLCLCLLDLDQFKALNDQAGHVYGNAVLRYVAQCFQAGVRKADAVFRIGGDEFAILLPGAGLETAQHAAERILAILASGDSPRQENAQQSAIPIHCSIGIAELSPRWLDPDAFIKVADDALYRAKELGGGIIVTSATESGAPHSVHMWSTPEA